MKTEYLRRVNMNGALVWQCRVCNHTEYSPARIKGWKFCPICGKEIIRIEVDIPMTNSVHN